MESRTLTALILREIECFHCQEIKKESKTIQWIKSINCDTKTTVLQALGYGCYTVLTRSSKVETAYSRRGVGVGGTLGISGWGCAAETEPLAYTRANSVEFCYPILE